MGPMQPELHEKLAALLAICQKMNSERDLGALLDLMVREATHLLDCDRASIFLLDREHNQLWSKVALGSDEILRFDARMGIAGKAVQTGEVVNVRDAYSHPEFYNAIDSQTGYRTRNVLAVAVRNQRGEIVGAFEALNKHTGAFGARAEGGAPAVASPGPPPPQRAGGGRPHPAGEIRGLFRTPKKTPGRVGGARGGGSRCLGFESRLI